jgi:hypothetical protein
MIEDTEVPVVDTTPELEATAAPAPEVETPDEKPSESKVFTQEELDAAIGKRLAREQRKWEREQARLAAERQAVAAPANVSQDQFNSVEEYAAALATQKAEELLRQREMSKQQAELREAYADREEDARGRYDDFEQVAYNPSLPITNVMAEAIQASDVGPDVAYYLGSNPKEADRISRLSPTLQAKEIGKLEAKLANDPPVKKTSSAPSPLSPVKPKGSNAPTVDTTDPRSIQSMSTSEWIAAERARQIKKMEAMKYR